MIGAQSASEARVTVTKSLTPNRLTTPGAENTAFANGCSASAALVTLNISPSVTSRLNFIASGFGVGVGVAFAMDENPRPVSPLPSRGGRRSLRPHGPEPGRGVLRVRAEGRAHRGRCDRGPAGGIRRADPSRRAGARPDVVVAIPPSLRGHRPSRRPRDERGRDERQLSARLLRGPQPQP